MLNTLNIIIENGRLSFQLDTEIATMGKAYLILNKVTNNEPYVVFKDDFEKIKSTVIEMLYKFNPNCVSGDNVCAIYIDTDILDLSKSDLLKIKINKDDIFNKSKALRECLLGMCKEESQDKVSKLKEMLKLMRFKPLKPVIRKHIYGMPVDRNEFPFGVPVLRPSSETETRTLPEYGFGYVSTAREELRDRAIRSIHQPMLDAVKEVKEDDDYYVLLCYAYAKIEVKSISELNKNSEIVNELDIISNINKLYDLGELTELEEVKGVSRKLTTDLIDFVMKDLKTNIANKVVRIVFTATFLNSYRHSIDKTVNFSSPLYFGINHEFRKFSFKTEPYINFKICNTKMFMLETESCIKKLKAKGEI